MIRNLLAAMATAILIITPIHTALANCAQRDFSGEWQFYNTWWNGLDGFNWSRCTFVLDKNGEFLSAFDCEDSNEFGTFEPLIMGQLSVTQDCVVTGFAIFDGEQANFVHAVMNGRKDMIVGVGEDVGEANFWTFNMIEK